MSHHFPHLTAKERNFPSWPTKHLFKKGLLKGTILDFGSGFGADGKFLRKKGFEVVDYDNYYYPDYPNTRFDTIICNYVLNVVEPEEQAEILMQISELLKPTGKAYFSVRRDVPKGKFGTGKIRIHKKHKKPTFQTFVELPYKSVFKNESCEIYEYKHFNQIPKKTECPFCNPNSEREIITESATTYAIYDKYPVNKGHALIIPKQHIPDYFDLSNHSQRGCLLVLNRVKKIIAEKFNPAGFNVGVNVGETAGQTIPHVHIHLIPRYMNDIENPVGGVRNIIPGKGDYLK